MYGIALSVTASKKGNCHYCAYMEVLERRMITHRGKDIELERQTSEVSETSEVLVSDFQK